MQFFEHSLIESPECFDVVRGTNLQGYPKFLFTLHQNREFHRLNVIVQNLQASL